MKKYSDLPAIFAVGAQYQLFKKLMVAGCFNYYFDQNVDYDGSEMVEINMIDENFIEFGIGAEYAINEKLRASAGFSATLTGVNGNYQSDQTYSANTGSFGAGFGYRISRLIDLNVGGQYTIYATASKDFNHMLGTVPIPVQKRIIKSTWLIGIGLDFSLINNKYIFKIF